MPGVVITVFVYVSSSSLHHDKEVSKKITILSISLKHVRNRIPVGINYLVSSPVLAFQMFDVIFEVFLIFSCVEAPVNRWPC